jgi:hypothetical protein
MQYDYFWKRKYLDFRVASTVNVNQQKKTYSEKLWTVLYFTSKITPTGKKTLEGLNTTLLYKNISSKISGKMVQQMSRTAKDNSATSKTGMSPLQ